MIQHNAMAMMCKTVAHHFITDTVYTSIILVLYWYCASTALVLYQYSTSTWYSTGTVLVSTSTVLVQYQYSTSTVLAQY